MAEAGARLGVSNQSHYMLVKVVGTSKDEKQVAELIEAKWAISASVPKYGALKTSAAAVEK